MEHGFFHVYIYIYIYILKLLTRHHSNLRYTCIQNHTSVVCRRVSWFNLCPCFNAVDRRRVRVKGFSYPIYKYKYIWICINMHTYVYIYILIHLFYILYIYVYIYTYIHTYTIYIHTHIHIIHTYIPSSPKYDDSLPSSNEEVGVDGRVAVPGGVAG
jgi:hypothetical protein